MTFDVQKTPLEQAISDEAAAQTQDREIRRVEGRIDDFVLQFLYIVNTVPRVYPNREFHLDDLESHVRGCCDQQQQGYTAGSAGRILRMMRTEARIDYICVDRASSRYRLTALPKQEEP